MTRVSPLQRLLSLIENLDPATRPITLLSAAELEALSARLRPALEELSVADLTAGSASQLSHYSLREGATFLEQVAEAIPALPALGAALQVSPQDLLSLSDLLVQLAALERALQLCHEGADTGLLHALSVGSGYAQATVDAVQAAIDAPQVPDATRALLVSQASALDEHTRRARATQSAAETETAARVERDDAQDIKDFVAAVKGGTIATMALPGKKTEDNGKARRARSLQ